MGAEYMGIVSSRPSNRLKELCSSFFLQSQFSFSLEVVTITLRPVGTLVARGSFFPYKLDDTYQVSCADPNGANNFKSLRASSCERCAELCRLTGGCNYWTWVPHFIDPVGHRNCKLFKNFCCKTNVNEEKGGIRISGSKFQNYCGY